MSGFDCNGCWISYWRQQDGWYFRIQGHGEIYGPFSGMIELRAEAERVARDAG